MKKSYVWLLFRQYYEEEDPVVYAVARTEEIAKALLDQDDALYPLCSSRWYELFNIVEEM